MAYRIHVEELALANYPITLDCYVEIDGGHGGQWVIDSIEIESFDGNSTMHLKRGDMLFYAIDEAIHADKGWVAHIDSEADENNQPSLVYDRY
jgi:hypothetical protein